MDQSYICKQWLRADNVHIREKLGGGGIIGNHDWVVQVVHLVSALKWL